MACNIKGLQDPADCGLAALRRGFFLPVDFVKRKLGHFPPAG